MNKKLDFADLAFGMALSFLPLMPNTPYNDFKNVFDNNYSNGVSLNISFKLPNNNFKNHFYEEYQDTIKKDKIKKDTTQININKIQSINNDTIKTDTTKIIKKFNSIDDLFYEYQDVLHNINSNNVPVLMFHEINKNENRYTVSPNNFRLILEELYKKDFYALSLKEFYEADFSNVPIDKKPLLITFDDATPGQFTYINDSIDKNCAVSIMNNFYLENPDFGKGAVFFISYGSKNNFKFPFGCEKSLNKKLVYLTENGYDVGWHTPLHPDNTSATKNNVLEQKIILDALLNLHIGEQNFNNLTSVYAHPFGAEPSNVEVNDFLKEQYTLVMDAWGGHSKHPLNKNFNVKAIPRIEMHVKNLGLVTNVNSYVVRERDKEFYDFFKEIKSR